MRIYKEISRGSLHFSLILITNFYRIKHGKRDIERVRLQLYPNNSVKIGRIKALRHLDPTISLKDAKNFIEERWKDE